MKVMEKVENKRMRVTEKMAEDLVIATPDHEDHSLKAADGLVDQVFNNYVLTDCIFEILPISDIVSCSSVSKTWNTVSREFLRRKRICLLTCHLQDLEGLDSQLKLLQNDILNNHPFKGVNVIIGNLFDYEERHARVQFHIQEILTRVTPKYLSISFTSTKDSYEERSWFLDFVSAWQSMNQTEYLRVEGRERIAWWKHNELPNLKTFQSDFIPPYFGTYGESQHQIAFIRRCPALTEYMCGVYPSSLRLFHKDNKLPLVRWIHIHDWEVIDDDILERMEELAVPVEILSFKIYQVQMDTNQRKSVSRLLHVCRNTLKKAILLNFFGPHRVEDVRIPPMPTISEVVVEHGSNRTSYSDVVHDVGLRYMFPNARITPKVVHTYGYSTYCTDSSSDDKDSDSSN